MVLLRVGLLRLSYAKNKWMNSYLSDERAMLAANVTVQIVRGLITLYGEAGEKAKDLIVEGFKKVLTLYLGSVWGS